jgi:CheY-like chemotaxis protein
MKEIVDWLRTVEDLAHDLYSRASEFFANDKDLSAFLLRLGQDESWHFHLMGSASDFITKSETPVVSAIKIDPITIHHAEDPLRQSHLLLSMGTLTQEQIIETITKAERSEWNIIFLYAINTLKTYSKEFEHAASVIQSHQDRIEDFLGRHPHGRRYVNEIRQLPAVWQQKFLVVDDQEPLRVLLSDLLEWRGVVETACDGIEGLEKTRRHFFDVVISDIDMPTMSGLDFYREAAHQDPGIGRHFIFCSGEIAVQHEQFFRDNDLLYLRKPFAVDDLTKMIERVLLRCAEDSERATQINLNPAPTPGPNQNSAIPK